MSPANTPPKSSLTGLTKAVVGDRSLSFRQMCRECPICGSSELAYEFVVDAAAVCGCRRCGLLFLNPQPLSGAENSSDTEASYPVIPRQETPYDTNTTALIAQFARYTNNTTGRLLIAGGDPVLVADAQRRNYEVLAITSADLEDGILDAEDPGSFDGCILFCSLERSSNPRAVLETVQRLLLPGGSLMVVAPTLDSPAARRFGVGWWEFHRRNQFYFSVDTLQCLLFKAGFGDPIVEADRSGISLDYLLDRMAPGSSRLRRSAIKMLASVSPHLARHFTFRFPASRSVVLCRRKEVRRSPKLSVIVPVYNEHASFKHMMSQLLAKRIAGVEIEVIVVESCSTDGTREDALSYGDHSRVRLVLEDRPRGKGHAVRRGLEFATGDVVLIQDADLEYDINDYDALIAPILRGEQNFVIGSRHSAGDSVWKLRHFEDAKGVSAIFNLGHIVFLSIFNVLYRQRLTDPFSMYKVFRRDCLYGLTFECNRFDFDFEIVIKLIRKGYQPMEIGVNYQSRSLSEGKKVRMLRDPVTWLRALLRFRHSPIYAQSNQQH